MSVSLFAVLPASALVAYLVVVLPMAGRARYRALQTGAFAEFGSRTAAYRSGIVRQWLLTAVALGVLAAAGAPLADVGLSLRIDHPGKVVPGLAALAATGILLALLLRRWPSVRARALRPVSALLPVTRSERRLFVGVAVTAGVAEEILFRGFLLVYLTEVFPHLPLGLAMVISSALFGLAHAYQGWLGILCTGLAGYWLAGLFVLTGSLLLPAVVHALVDLRLLLVLPPQEDG